MEKKSGKNNEYNSYALSQFLLNINDRYYSLIDKNKERNFTRLIPKNNKKLLLYSCICSEQMQQQQPK